MRLKKNWSKPLLRRVRVSEQFDPADGLTRRQWEAARAMRGQAEKAATNEDTEGAATLDADVLR